MDSVNLLILNVCFETLREGSYSINTDLLIEKMARLCYDEYDDVEGRIEFLWENNYLVSSNGEYFLTDKSLDLITKINGTIN